MRHLPFSGLDGALEVERIAVGFEEKIYTAATSQADYLRKISLKMLTLDLRILLQILFSLMPQVIVETPKIQVINHGIPSSLTDDTMNVMKEFFTTPPDYKASFYSTEISKKCRIYSSTLNYDHEEVHYWRDNFTHHCHPLQDQIHLWPQNPTRYREVVGKYSIETRNLALTILELISEGLGLKPKYFQGETSKLQLLSVNHHIPCPDPSLTLGMPQHSDPNLITLLHQGSVPGLQVLHHNQWMNVEPTPHAFLVIPGLQLKVISNGRFSSPVHRVITHSGEARTTIGTFFIPSHEIIIQPAQGSDPVYRGFKYNEFLSCFTKSNCEADVALGLFKNETK